MLCRSIWRTLRDKRLVHKLQLQDLGFIQDVIEDWDIYLSEVRIKAAKRLAKNPFLPIFDEGHEFGSIVDKYIESVVSRKITLNSTTVLDKVIDTPRSFDRIRTSHPFTLFALRQ